jgi:hypothetical protein
MPLQACRGARCQGMQNWLLLSRERQKQKLHANAHRVKSSAPSLACDGQAGTSYSSPRLRNRPDLRLASNVLFPYLRKPLLFHLCSLPCDSWGCTAPAAAARHVHVIMMLLLIAHYLIAHLRYPFHPAAYPCTQHAQRVARSHWQSRKQLAVAFGALSVSLCRHSAHCRKRKICPRYRNRH